MKDFDRHISLNLRIMEFKIETSIFLKKTINSPLDEIKLIELNLSYSKVSCILSTSVKNMYPGMLSPGLCERNNYVISYIQFFSHSSAFEISAVLCGPVFLSINRKSGPTFK